MPRPLIIGCRTSALARLQAQLLYDKLIDRTPRPCSVRGTKRLEFPPDEDGFKGIFITGLEAALRTGVIDIAVHSMKDVPGGRELDEDFALHSILPRDNPLDALITGHGAITVHDLPSGGQVATSSPRRQAQLASLRPDLSLVSLRGNVDTRLAKASCFDGIILAACGLTRLGRKDQISSLISIEHMLPAAGQGTLAVQYRREDDDIAELLAPLVDEETQLQTQAERGFLHGFGGDCTSPLAAFASVEKGQVFLRTQHLRSENSRSDAKIEKIEKNIRMVPSQAWEIGVRTGEDLRATSKSRTNLAVESPL
ncbi:MAG: hydroxymethylbilane synthase [Pseudomonadota bacterium]